MTLRIDTSARGYRYMSRSEQASARNIDWLGIVESDGEIGALGLTGGRYYLFSSGRKPIELATAEVLQAMAHPEHINPRGRKVGARGPQKPHSVTMDPVTKGAASELGEGNVSLGIRLAVDYVRTQVHPEQFKKWRAEQGEG